MASPASWSNRVVWQEGMFLRAQHFQQQDRWLEGLVRSLAASLRPYGWGVLDASVNRDLLATGQFALASATGLFEDGTPFALPGETDQPAPLELMETARNVVVYLALPMQQPGAVEVAFNGQHEGRLELREFEAYDTHSLSPQPARLQVGRLRLRYMLETDNRAGYHCIGLARVVEVGADRRVRLDEDWIAPCLLCSAAPPLAGLLTLFAGMLNQRGETLGARLASPGAHGVGDVKDLLLLQSINRAQNLLGHWADTGNVHPADLYAKLLQIAGEFATLIESGRRPRSYPSYRHEDLQRSFAPLVADLRRYFEYVDAPTAIQIPLRDPQHNVRVGPIKNREILRSSTFVLAVQAEVPTEKLMRLFPSQVKIGAVEEIVQLVNVQLPGIEVRPLAAAPRQLPFYAGWTYFELDRNSPHWKRMQTSAAFAIHVPADDFPNIGIELWAIRG